LFRQVLFVLVYPMRALFLSFNKYGNNAQQQQ